MRKKIKQEGGTGNAVAANLKDLKKSRKQVKETWGRAFRQRAQHCKSSKAGAARGLVTRCFRVR